MAANKFASMVHKNTHKIAVILIYALLEWLLITLLLLNSLFAYFITKFASYFGLKPPCLFCSRLDCNKNTQSYTQLLCENHASDVSRITYCTKHSKLSESDRMCGNCMDSQFVGMESRFDSDSCVTRENIENVVQFCSCCNESCKNTGLVYGNDEQNEIVKETGEQEHMNRILDGVTSFVCNKEGETKEDQAGNFSSNEINRTSDEKTTQFCLRKDDSLRIMTLHRKSFDFYDLDRPIPVEFIDSSSLSANQGSLDVKKNDQKEQDHQCAAEDEALVPNSEELKQDSDEQINAFQTLRADRDQNGEEEEVKELDEPSDTNPTDEYSKLEKQKSSKAIQEVKVLNVKPNDVEDDKLPCTPTSTENLRFLHKKLLSLDGGVVSEMDGGDTILTTLEAEQKALSCLYTELEEERSASAIAANQTMAMITRLQEEKAAIQMEALQYQRMMEEQSEYDQEALQLLNDLMVKREQEKMELEKELELFKDKVSDYEAKERSRTSSGSCSNMEYSDDLSLDFNSNKTLTDFEEERLSILDQLKGLEEKLLTFDEEAIENTTSIKQITMASMAKSLLPLLDAAYDHETEEGQLMFEEQVDDVSIGRPNSIASDYDLDDKKEAIIKQVDGVYERLHALETDKEFLSHCMSSVEKGDKGTDLLHEILQHLRDLKTIELHEGIVFDETLSQS